MGIERKSNVSEKILFYFSEAETEADKTAKKSLDMPEMTMTRLPRTDYYLTIRRGKNSRMAKGMGKQY